MSGTAGMAGRTRSPACSFCLLLAGRDSAGETFSALLGRLRTLHRAGPVYRIHDRACAPAAGALLASGRRGCRAISQERALLSWCGVAALYLPWTVTLALDARAVASSYWIPPPTWSGLRDTILEFAGFQTPCASFPCRLGQAATPAVDALSYPIAVALAACALATAGLSLVRRNLTVFILCAWLLAPVTIIAVLAVRRSLFLDRVFLDATFPLYLLAGAGSVAA